ncbi:S8 family serine peptidase [Gracilimonas amylolytica]|uniref:S8 family serine peptidase n=1 Tax=Gracilimonas amylolytica TaxID=1749045 RepID=UPI000CD8E680|nr:S8 family serine peptidase [Gracilimonas amylolytica]
MCKLQKSFPLILFSFLFIYGSIAYAQQPEYYRYVHGEKVAMQAIENEYMVTYEDEPGRPAELTVQATYADRKSRFTMKEKQHERYTLRSQNFIEAIKQEYPFAHISPVFLNEDNREQFASNEIMVVWPKNMIHQEIKKFEQEFNLERIENKNTRWLGDRVLYQLLPPFEFTSIETANRLYELGVVERASVNWVFDIEFHTVSTNDEHFGDQWNIGKTSLNKTWEIVTGSTDVVIAVADEGVDLTHDDLTPNLFLDPVGNVIGINTTDTGAQNDPTPNGDDAHGTASSGIIAGVANNTDGIAGACWNCRIMPIQIARNNPQDPNWTYSDWIIDGINFAWTNGADIISNSWGGTGHDQDVEDEFNDAANSGAIIVASSGNYYPRNPGQTQIRYPAAFNSVIAVGATRENDERKELNDGSGEDWGSAFGSELDIVAPGIHIPTTDISGGAGYQNGDYELNFNGTSSAAPLVSGIISLMLSVNPNLTPAQIQTILQNTADQVSGMGGQGFTNEYGHGRLNAYKAVKEAMPNQYSGQSFTSSTTLPDLSRIKDFTSVSSGITLTISSGDVTIIDGNMSGSNSTIAVNGRLIIEEAADLNNIHLDVGSGGELTIREGASLSFDSGQGIVGNGIVTIEGTNANRISLQASGSSNWDGVEVNEDNSSIKYVDIQDAVNGITSYNVSGLEVQNVEVFNSTWDGFRFINTSTSSPVGGFGYFRADGNGTYGVYYDGGLNDELRNSIMVDNPAAGLYITGGASLEGVINSRIYNGGTNGLRADNTSFLEITSSSIHDNAYRDAFAYNNSTINATSNWWGSSFPSSSQFEEVSGGSIDYSNHLFFDPLPSSFQKQANSTDNAPKAKTSEHSVTTISSVANLRKALSGFKGEEALTELNRISGQELSPALNQWAKIIQVELHQRLDNHQLAIETGNALLASQVTSQKIRTTMGRRLFYSYLLGTKDVQAAETMLLNLEHWEEDEIELKQLAWLLERHKEDAPSGGGKELTQSIAQETDIQLSNYPNPFNPSTVIKYELTQNTTVRLQVFDMLGREVVTLVDEQQSAGEYSATFDASMLSSGNYIYRLQVGSQVVTKQMTLIK